MSRERPFARMTPFRSRLLVAGTLTLFGLCAIAIGLRAQATPITRGPYLQMGTASGVVVRWRTATPVDSVVRYGTAPGQLTAVASLTGTRTEHEVALGGLAPHTRYFYSVGTSATVLAGGDRDHAFTTAPPAGTRAPLRLWVLGDAGTANATARAVRDGYLARESSGGTQALLFLGDNAYPNGTDAEYQAAVFDTYRDVLRRAVSWSTYGNHDANAADAATQSGPYFDLFTLPRRGEAGGVPSGTEAYYSFDLANVHVVSLDSSESDRTAGGPMATWLRADLAANHAEWTIAFFHHAPYSRGTHDSDVDPDMREMREQIVPILEAGGVDVVLAGHSHTYERSAFITGHYGPASTFSPAYVLDGAYGDDHGYQKRRGTAAGAVYVLSGSAGVTAPAPLDHPAMRSALANTGSLAIDIDGGRLQAFYLRETGDVNDAFTLLKRDAAGPPAAPWGLRTQEVLEPNYLSWRQPEGGGPIEGYRIEAGSAPGRSDIGALTVGPTTVQRFGRINGRLFVRVRAFNAAGMSPPSEDLEIVMAGGFANGVVPADVRPPTPSGVVTATITGSTVVLSSPTGGYGELANRFDIGTRPGATDIGSVWIRGIVAPAVPPGVYFVRFVRANQAGESGPSLDTQVVVGNVPAPPDRPGLVRAMVSGQTVAMTWAPPSGPDPVDHYVIEAGLTARTTAVRLATPDARPELTVAGVPAGAYFVRVRGVNAVGEGVTSADRRVVVP